MNLLFWLFAKLPPDVLRALLRFAARVVHALGIRRKIARRNVALAFPEMDERSRDALVRANYLHLGECAADFLRSPKMSDEALFSMVEADDYEKVRGLIEAKEGLIVPTAHFGNFELFGVWAGRRGVPIAILTRVLKGSANAAWVKTRELAGVREIHKGWNNLFDAVRRGDALALLIDQNMLRRRAVFVPFFGIEAATTPSPAKVAIETGAPVFLALLKRVSRGKYRLIIEGPLHFERKSDDLQDDIRAFTARLNECLERQIRESPEQWFWVHRRFKTRPNEGDPDLY
ncbi:MAG: lysophospholipid acyltransferase family protein [Myxococcales bacterium]|jgi:KDO2-lipid IV(A) lauroyltransferase|nr:lysophospholipid acyltransferase family protein [Myxococcales bacterium]